MAITYLLAHKLLNFEKSIISFILFIPEYLQRLYHRKANEKIMTEWQ